jgi:hypothetical protein
MNANQKQFEPLEPVKLMSLGSASKVLLEQETILNAFEEIKCALLQSIPDTASADVAKREELYAQHNAVVLLQDQLEMWGQLFDDSQVEEEPTE